MVYWFGGGEWRNCDFYHKTIKKEIESGEDWDGTWKAITEAEMALAIGIF